MSTNRQVQTMISVDTADKKAAWLLLKDEHGNQRIVGVDFQMSVELWVDGIEKTTHINNWLAGNPKIQLWKPQAAAK